MGECWIENVDEYEKISLYYNLTPPQKLQYIHNIVMKDSQRFYIERVKAYATTFEKSVRMISEEYNSPVRQGRVKYFLNSLRVHDYVGDNTDAAMALTKVYNLVLKLSLKVPTSNRGDGNRIEFLRRAVIGYDWSREPLSRVATNGVMFQKLYGELEVAVQMEKESRSDARKYMAGSSLRDKKNDSVEDNYDGKGREVQSTAPTTSNSRNQPKEEIGTTQLNGMFQLRCPGSHGQGLRSTEQLRKSSKKETLITPK